MHRLLKTVLPFALLLTLSMPIRPDASAATPIADELKTAVDRVLSIMQDPTYAAPEAQQERQKRISDAIKKKFDWKEMARRALGRHWRDLTPAQQKEFIGIFNQFLERTYIARVDLFLKEEKPFSQKNITYGTATVDGRYALVESTITLQDHEIPLSYKLINKAGKWVVYDLTLEGVSIVANYRTQFNAILANGSYEQLIEKLKAKQNEDGSKAPAVTAAAHKKSSSRAHR